jgi:carboxylate-amine ligase
MRTVGVEEELLLVDATSGAPRAVSGAALRFEAARTRTEPAPDDRSPGGTLGPELQQQQIEIDTTPCTDLADLARQLRMWRTRADDAARSAGARAVALATSPLPVAPQTTVKPRYQRMAEHFGLTTVEQLTCGCHVHVGVGSEDEAVAVADRVRIWLPALLAISANSPYWQQVDSGYASFRSQAWTRFPTAGPTEIFGSAEAYRQRVNAMINSGTVLDAGMIYFDVRPSEVYPTVEFRTADVCMRAEDAVLIAALCRAMVDTAVQAWRSGEPAEPASVIMLRLASWRAGRSGTADQLLDPYSWVPRPAGEVLARLVDHCRGALRQAGDEELVDSGIARILADGTGATRQRMINGGTGDLSAVVHDAIGVTHRQV